MKDMDKAVERVERAVRNREKIMVYGDYDVDGTTAVALVYKFLRQIGHKDLLFYIPDRYTEGYGISTKGIDHAARKGATLIIALDCGIKAIEKVDYAKRKGVDFIICDHHLPAEEIPRAVAVLDPKRTDCSYPFDELSGCGVGFKLVQAYCQKNGIPFQQIEPLLDLLAVSIASDIVPLVDENRILATTGLLRLNASPRRGCFRSSRSAAWIDTTSPSTTSSSKSAPASTPQAVCGWMKTTKTPLLRAAMRRSIC